MKIGDLISVIEKFAPPELQEDYDNVGLITGNREDNCTGVIVALDVTPEVIEEALKKNANLVISHHPIIFRGLKKLSGNSMVEKVIIAAIRNDISIFAVHTNLDNVLMGVNGRIAKMLNLKNIRILQPKGSVLRRLITFAPHENAELVRDAIFSAGGGEIGKYSECSFNSQGEGTFKAGEGTNPHVGEKGERHTEPETKIEIVYPFYLERQIVEALVASHPYEEVAYDIFTMENIHQGIGAGLLGELEKEISPQEFLGLLKKVFQIPYIRHTEIPDKKLKTIALCGGAGSFLIPVARQAGADVFLTADLKYHDFYENGPRMMLADVGHFESEQFTIDLVVDLLLQKFPTFAVLKTGVKTNPVRYFAE